MFLDYFSQLLPQQHVAGLDFRELYSSSDCEVDDLSSLVPRDIFRAFHSSRALQLL